MDLSWLVISFNEIGWLIVIFMLGLAASKVGLPPLIGFLIVGFILKAYGFESTHELREIADLGVTLMLFTIGLKLDVKSLLKVQIWGVASVHMLITVIFFTLIIYVLSYSQLEFFSGVDIWTAVLIAFALSFSSTVFAIKVLESKSEMSALYAQIGIGILIMQDIFAVIFLTASTGKMPTPWALGLFFLPFARPVLYKLMDSVKHGELLVLYGLLLATGGAALFEIVGMKADLGALIFGILMARHGKAAELSKTLYSFKDLFLVAFFINIGLSGDPSLDHVILALTLSLLMFVKVVLFFLLLVKTHLRARTAFLTSLSLANYSEFGLIVGAIGVVNGWMSSDWLLIIAIALAITFVLASPLNSASHYLYTNHREWLKRWESDVRLINEQPVDTRGASGLVFGMGRIGLGVYEDLNTHYPGMVTGIDFNTRIYHEHKKLGRQVIYGDVMDQDFWSKLNLKDIKVVFLNLPEYEKNLFTIEQLKAKNYTGMIAAIAMYDEHMDELKQAGATAVYNFYSEAGIGFAEHVRHNLLDIELKNIE